ncbi:MAG: CAP domain-containing protein [Streptosporangiaceae bacterium]
MSQARVRPLSDHVRRTSYRIPGSPAPATPGTDTTSGQSPYRTNASDRSTANERSSGRSTTKSNSSDRSTTKSSSSGYANQSFAYSVLAQLNSERAAHGKRALTMNGELIVSAHAHNLAMARADQMSHQLPGEAYFADRISAAGYQYRNAGENIGWNSAVSRSGALALESDMYAEGPPPRGIINHYSNIVSSNYTNVGIEVWIDTVHDKLWLTEDFGGH